MDAIEQAAELGIDLRGHRIGDADFKTTCPRCSHARRKAKDPCLSVRLDRDGLLAHCFHCGWTVPERGTYRPAPVGASVRDRRREKSYTLPEPLPAPPPAHPDRLRTFFEGRGISMDTVDAAGVVLDAGAICFPYRLDGELVNVKRRFPGKRFSMEAGARLIMGGIDDCRGAETVTIVEGEMDLLALHECGVQAVLTPPNGAPSVETDIASAPLDYLEPALPVLEAARRVILAGDMDEPGRRFTEELARRIGREKCWRVEWPGGHKDANDVLMHDGPDAVRRALDAAIPYPVDGVTGPLDYLDIVRQGMSVKQAGVACPDWPALSQLYRVSEGQLTVLVGVPSSGKSQFMNALMMQITQAQGWKFGVFSPEYWPLDRLTSDLIECYTGKSNNHADTGHMTPEEAEAAVRAIADRFHFISPETPTVDEILARARALVFREGIKGLVIDPWTEIDRGGWAGSATDWIETNLKRFRRFGRQYGVHVFILVHPTKIHPMRYEKDADGSTIEPIVGLYDAADSRHWANMADCFLSIRRHRENPKKPVEVHVLKIRFRDNGRLGVALLEFDISCKRYRDVTWMAGLAGGGGTAA